ncbi:hypothetical protein FNF27_07360 [Cafeteria roenbergensis]|uniref:Thioredoxin domain-containing protein n=1 Tax=Cafeteria roenbergensis TaxID=33653 RepID=A0A5A8DRL4_CAFRO|nr:hypothetical protein FNF27_07360 [Cafeteria roenbergensis]
MARLLLAATAAAVLASAAARVVNLDDSSFQRAVGESSALLVKFYAPWCSHCQAMAPEVDALPAALEGLTNVNGDPTTVARVDCTSPASHETCTSLRVGGYPTVKLFTRDSAYAFDDRRTTDALKAFALEGFASSPSEPFVSTWHAPADQAAPAAAEADVQAAGEAGVQPAQERPAEPEAREPEAAPQPDEAAPQPDEAAPQPDEAAPQPDEAAPQPDEAAPQPDEAAPQPDEAAPQPEEAAPQPDEAAVGAGVEPVTVEVERPSDQQQEPEEPEEPEQLVFRADARESAVRELTEESFEHDTQAATGSTTGGWLVEFYAPWCPHCKSFAPQYEKVARALRARRAPVTVAKVDAAAHPALARRFGVLSFPSLRLIANGRVWAYPSDRSRSVASVVDFAQSAFKALPSEPVPPPATLLNQLQEELSAAAAAAVRLASSETQAVALIAASAFLGGMLVMLAITATVMCILPVPAPRAAPAPAQASIATSVARALGPAAAAQARHHSAAVSPSVGPGAGGTVTPPVDGTITPMILEADLSEDEAPILGAAASPKPKARRRKGARKPK